MCPVTAIVTGAAGFLGRALVSALLDAGEKVVGIDRRPYPGPAPAGLEMITADLLGDDPRVRAALETADAVYHLAGRPGVRERGPHVAAARRRDNVLAAARVLALVPPRVPLLVTSSSSVYGGARHGRPSRETDPPRPRGGYARSKAAMERLAARRRDVTLVRQFTLAGEGQRPDMAIARWLAAAREGRPLRVLGSLDRTRDITDVRQAARALIELTGVPGVVNLGTGHGHTLREMAHAVAAAVGREVRFEILPAPPDEPAASLADTRRLRRLIGWTPATDLPELVKRQAVGSQHG